MDTKKCSKCGETKELEEFYSNRSKKDGKSHYCKTCAKNRNREYRKCNPTLRKNQHNKYKKTISGRMTMLLADARRRSKMKGLKLELEVQDLEGIWRQQGGECALSGLPLDIHSEHECITRNSSPSIDKIDHKLGYVRGNIRLVCSWANSMRGSLSDSELLDKLTILKQGLEEKLGR